MHTFGYRGLLKTNAMSLLRHECIIYRHRKMITELLINFTHAYIYLYIGPIAVQWYLYSAVGYYYDNS
jgi:hypothetical protein